MDKPVILNNNAVFWVQLYIYPLCISPSNFTGDSESEGREKIIL